MTAKQGLGTLIQAAADLANHAFLPSWVADDYATKTMSTAKVAQRMGEASDQLKMLAMRVRQGADAMVAELDAKQAKIDALMLEFCPDEMTPDQRENWARAQRRVPRTFGGDGAVRGLAGRGDAAASRRIVGTSPGTISMTGQQVMDLLTLVAADCFQVVNRDSEVEFARETFREQMKSEVTIGFVDAHVTNEGEERPAGLYAWLTEYPEEGSCQVTHLVAASKPVAGGTC